jgi:hypothetical protein
VAAEARRRLQRWGYHVTTHGGQVQAAGHGAWHRWHGWRAVPAPGPWLMEIAVATARDGYHGAALRLDTPLGDVAWQWHTACGSTPWTTAVTTLLETLQQALEAFGVDQAQGLVCDPRLIDPVRALPTPCPVEVVVVDAERLPTTVDRARTQARVGPFDPHHLTVLRPGVYEAQGRARYIVDVDRWWCSCPGFTYRRTCKHLHAAASAAAPEPTDALTAEDRAWLHSGLPWPGD